MQLETWAHYLLFITSTLHFSMYSSLLSENITCKHNFENIDQPPLKHWLTHQFLRKAAVTAAIHPLGCSATYFCPKFKVYNASGHYHGQSVEKWSTTDSVAQLGNFFIHFQCKWTLGPLASYWDNLLSVWRISSCILMWHQHVSVSSESIPCS